MIKAASQQAPAGTAVQPSGVLVIDKPEGWTSHDVVARVRRILQTRKAGHTGTLDPMATGVLPVCVGDATKVAGLAQAADKVYQVTLRLGVATDTQDRTGTATAVTPLDPALDWDGLVRERLAGMVGGMLQTPPMYAAVKMGGEPLYKKARRGEVVERAPRRITIHAITDVVVAAPEVRFTVACGKGTYVRTLAADLGDALGVGAHLTALRRTACGPVGEADAVTLAGLEQAALEGDIARVMRGEDFLLADLPALVVSEYTAQRMVQGIAPTVSEWAHDPGGPAVGSVSPAPGLCRVYGAARGFFALVEIGTDPVRPARIRRIIKNRV